MLDFHVREVGTVQEDAPKSQVRCEFLLQRHREPVLTLVRTGLCPAPVPDPIRKDPRDAIQPQAKLNVLIKAFEGIWRGTDTSRVIPPGLVGSLPRSGGSFSLLPQGTFPVSTEGSLISSQACSGSFYPGGIPWLLLPRQH